MFDPCNVLLVSPRFPTNTYWNIKATCKISGARHTSPPLGLMTVAALLPAEWTCRLVDRNVTDLNEADLAWADLVMIGGMIVQRPDCLALIAKVQGCGKPVVIGGPDVMSDPRIYAHADFRVIGEAETIIGDFIAAWQSGQRSGTFTAEKFKADVTGTPVPRFDLIDCRNYVFPSVQFSRGCPFMCEFCDIITLYGRTPRSKTPEQMLAELEALYNGGHRGHVDFVDDNFIGNKKAVKAFLPHLIAWQREHDYPFIFSTEASINLADDDELLALMRKAGFVVVFIGIETPDGDTLVAAQKKQNTRRNIADGVHKIYRAGMFVMAGFIVGFDTEKGSVADDLVTCIEETDIAISIVSLLTALKTTHLNSRLEREKRLFPVSWQDRQFAEVAGDQCILGLNFETLRPRREVLSDYKSVVDRIYEPKAFFGRVTRTMRHLDCFWPPRKKGVRKARRFAGLNLEEWMALVRLVNQVIRVHPLLLGHYVKTFYTCALQNGGALRSVAMILSLHLHFGPFSRFVSAATARQIEEIDCGRWQTPLASLPLDNPVANVPAPAERAAEGARKVPA